MQCFNSFDIDILKFLEDWAQIYGEVVRFNFLGMEFIAVNSPHMIQVKVTRRILFDWQIVHIFMEYSLIHFVKFIS